MTDLDGFVFFGYVTIYLLHAGALWMVYGYQTTTHYIFTNFPFSRGQELNTVYKNAISAIGYHPNTKSDV